MPDQAPPLLRVADSGYDLLHRPGLVLPEYDLDQVVVPAQKDDIVMQDFEDSLLVKEGLDGVFVVALHYILPVEEVLSAGRPGGAVKEFDQFCDLEDLGQNQHLRSLKVVAPDLSHSLCCSISLLSVLRLSQCNGNAVDEKDGVRPVGESGTFMLPLISHLEDVIFWKVEVDELDISLSVLLRHIDRLLTSQPGESVPVALDAGTEEVELAQDLRSAGWVEHSWIELLELGQ